MHLATRLGRGLDDAHARRDSFDAWSWRSQAHMALAAAAAGKEARSDIAMLYGATRGVHALIAAPVMSPESAAWDVDMGSR